jgi:hypothetical protein
MSSQAKYQVARSGQVVGSFDAGEMIAKVATGQVLLTDHYWTAGMPAWLTVSTNDEWMRHVPMSSPSNQVAPPMPSTSHRPIRSYSAGTLVCTQCGCTGTESHTKGSFLIELILWLFFCIPGVIYSIWRLTTRGQVCSACKSDRLVPASSPAGQNLLSRS